MKNTLTIFLLITLSTISFAQNRPFAFAGYSGGMMLHSGYVSGQPIKLYSSSGSITEVIQLKGLPTGIGGALKINLGTHLRIGGEGYVSTLHYSEFDSYSTTGWGGLLADWTWEKGRWTWFAGGTIGGGSVRNLTLLADTPTDCELEEQSVSFRHYSFMAAAPFVGAEFALTQRIHIIFKVDYLCNLTNPQADFVTGPRLYTGFMFCHQKK